MAQTLALEEGRLQLTRAPGGEALDLGRTPAELGLDLGAGAPPATIWAEEAAAKTIRLYLRLGSSKSENVALDVPPTATFRELV